MPDSKLVRMKKYDTFKITPITARSFSMPALAAWSDYIKNS
jgi:hypothetical protein